MGNWMTAAELTERYFVGEERLLEYSRRGNLPFRRDGRDSLLFDERVAARFFRPRSGSVVAFRSPRGPNLGVLGLGRLGEPVGAVPSGGRDGRRRALRLANIDSAPQQIKKVAG